MKLRELMILLDADVLTDDPDLDMDIQMACGADLMSDVMAYVKENVVLLTGLMNPQVIRTAEMMDINVVVFIRGKVPEKRIVELAQENKITVLATRYPMYIACGKLYKGGLGVINNH
ncbi:MAG: DRTGG domain-containing protein [Clostridia bacterium]